MRRRVSVCVCVRERVFDRWRRWDSASDAWLVAHYTFYEARGFAE